jgi:glycosyltransferase involved in cell wall biosynthesis
MHVIDSLDIGGAERMLVDMVNNIDPERYSVSVCVTRSAAPLQHEIHRDIPVKLLHRKYKWSIAGFTKLAEFSLQQRVDLYHAHGLSTFSFLLFAKRLGIIQKPILLHDHFGDIEIARATPKWFKYWGRASLDYYVGVSKKLVDWAINAGVSQTRATTIENALDIKRYAQVPAINLHHVFQVPIEKKVAVMIGNIRPSKGLDILIRVCTSLNRDIIPVFVILGRVQDASYYKTCQDMIAKADLEEFFIFLGAQPDRIAWIKGADFAVIPSISESGPLVLIEYIACGLPFASMKVGGISELVYPSIPDAFASPLDIDRFSAILNRLAILPKIELKVLGEKIQKDILEMFDIRNKLSCWYAIYDEIIRERRIS